MRSLQWRLGNEELSFLAGDLRVGFCGCVRADHWQLLFERPTADVSDAGASAACDANSIGKSKTCASSQTIFMPRVKGRSGNLCLRRHLCRSQMWRALSGTSIPRRQRQWCFATTDPAADHCCLRAVAGALQYAKINLERAHRLAILVSQNSRDLVKMS